MSINNEISSKKVSVYLKDCSYSFIIHKREKIYRLVLGGYYNGKKRYINTKRKDDR